MSLHNFLHDGQAEPGAVAGRVVDAIEALEHVWELLGIDPLAGIDYRQHGHATANTDLEQGLKWADASINMPFVGQTNFDTLSTKALILAKLGREPEAKTIMDAALKLPSTTAIQIHQYGRQLLAAKKNSEAMAIFQYNAERNGEVWPTNVGLARGYAAIGDNKQALEHAQKALAQAPDPLNKKGLEDMVKALEQGQSIQ